MKTIHYAMLLTALLTTEAEATAGHNINHQSDGKKATLSKDNQFYAFMNQPELLTIASYATDEVIQISLPRVDHVTELAWSNDNTLLSFTAKGREHWLYNFKDNTIRLIESVPKEKQPVKFSPQWSADSKWLLFTSHKSATSKPRVYSLGKKRSFGLPVSADEFSHIAWSRSGKSISLSDFIGTEATLANFNAYGITLVQQKSSTLAVANK